MGTNVCVIEGRLTKDADHSVFGANATPKLSFSLANNTGYGDYVKTNFFNCEIIGKSADGLAPYMVKGKAVNLTGEMQQQRWEKDGEKHNKWILHVLNTSFTSGSKSDSSEAGEEDQTQHYKKAPASNGGTQQGSSKKPDPFAAALAGATSEADEDDIPF
jgi:single-strand DNA-binding protein